MPIMTPPPMPPAVVFVADCRRYVHINHDGQITRIDDNQPSLNRSAADLIEEYVRQYKTALSPHLAECARLTRAAQALRKKERKPNLP
jgi:hypothetical protein